MNFNKVKKSGDNYIADGMFIPNEESNRHYAALQKWVKEGGNIEEEFNITDLKRQKIKGIKKEASTRIINQYPMYRQINVLMSREVEEIFTINKSIKYIRRKSNFLEKTLSKMTLSELKNFDASKDSHWK